MVEKKQVWEYKYETDTREQFKEITELKFNLRVEKIGQAELRAENQSVWNVFRAMEQSLREHKDYIVELWEDNVRQTVDFEKALAKAWRDREDWRAQCLAR